MKVHFFIQISIVAQKRLLGICNISYRHILCALFQQFSQVPQKPILLEELRTSHIDDVRKLQIFFTINGTPFACNFL